MGNANQKPSSISSSTQTLATATTTVDLCKLLAELECSVCLNLFTEPKSLPCGHINCASCVQGVIDVATEPDLFINCPQCRAELQVPADGQFPTAFVVKNLVTLIKQVDGAHSEGRHDKSEASNSTVASKKRFYSIDFHDVDCAESIWMRIWLALFPNKVSCYEKINGKMTLTPIRLDQLDTFLNDEQVERAVRQISFRCVQFDEPMVQMLRRIKRERFEQVDANGRNRMNISWNCSDFSRISEASFRFLLDELFPCPAQVYIICKWTGVPAAFDYNTLFQLKAFRNAWYIEYCIGTELHLKSDVLIDYLHMPDYRKLKLLDGQLHDGFDSFLDRLIERFNEDNERRYYALTVLVSNATEETKERLKLDEEPQNLQHPYDMGKLKLEWTKAIGLNNDDNVFEFNAKRSCY